MKHRSHKGMFKIYAQDASGTRAPWRLIFAEKYEQALAQARKESGLGRFKGWSFH